MSILALRSQAASASVQAEVNADNLRKRGVNHLNTLKDKQKHAEILLRIQQRSLKTAESNLATTSKVYSSSQAQTAELKSRADAALKESERETLRIRNDISHIEKQINEMNAEISKLEKSQSKDVL